MQEKLTLEEQKILLRLARESIERAVKGQELPSLDLSVLPARLREMDVKEFTVIPYCWSS